MSMHMNGSGSLDWNASLPLIASSWSWNDKHVELVTGNSMYNICHSATLFHMFDWLGPWGKMPSKPLYMSQWLRSTRFEQCTHCTADIFPSPKEVASYCVTEDGSSWADALTSGSNRSRLAAVSVCVCVCVWVSLSLDPPPLQWSSSAPSLTLQPWGWSPRLEREGGSWRGSTTVHLV